MLTVIGAVLISLLVFVRSITIKVKIKQYLDADKKRPPPTGILWGCVQFEARELVNDGGPRSRPGSGTRR